MRVIVYRLGSLASLASAVLVLNNPHSWYGMYEKAGAIRTATSTSIDDDIVLSKRDFGRWFSESKSVKMKDIDLILVDTDYSEAEMLAYAKLFGQIFVLSPRNLFPNEIGMKQENIFKCHWVLGMSGGKSIIHLTAEMIGIKFQELGSHMKYISVHDTKNADVPEDLSLAQSFILSFRHFYDHDYKGFKMFLNDLTERGQELMDELLSMGAEFLAMAEKDIARTFKPSQTHRFVMVGPYNAPIINLPKRLVSLVNSHYYEKYELVVFYQDIGTMRHFELRTVHDDVDLYQLVKRFDGGGRQKAAGFTMKIDQAYRKGLY